MPCFNFPGSSGNSEAYSGRARPSNHPGGCASVAVTIDGLCQYGYNSSVEQEMKPLRWVASAKKDIQAMPGDVQDTFGYALHLAQTGKKLGQAKPLKGFGSAGVL